MSIFLVRHKKREVLHFFLSAIVASLGADGEPQECDIITTWPACTPSDWHGVLSSRGVLTLVFCRLTPNSQLPMKAALYALDSTANVIEV